MARAKPQGSTTAAVGACSAPQTWGESPGSSARAASPESSSSPGTPLARPRSYSVCRWGSCSGAKASTSEPVCLTGTSSLRQMSSAMRLPSTFRAAILVPGSGS